MYLIIERFNEVVSILIAEYVPLIFMHSVCLTVVHHAVMMKIKDSLGQPTEVILVSDMNTYDDWREKVEPFLTSKLEEFHLLGMQRITRDALWEFSKERFAKQKEELKCHRIVGHLMSLSINDYLNKIRMEMFKNTDIFMPFEKSSVK